jgi:hypothetical protein
VKKFNGHQNTQLSDIQISSNTLNYDIEVLLSILCPYVEGIILKSIYKRPNTLLILCPYVEGIIVEGIIFCVISFILLSRLCLSSAESIRDKRKAGLEIDAEQLASYSQRSGGSGHLPRVRVPPPPPPRMEGCVWLHRILSLQGINFDSQEQQSQCTTVLGVSIRLGARGPAVLS